MANLFGQNIGTNYKGILNLDTLNTPLDATLRAVTDGEGNASPLRLSTTRTDVGTFTFLGGTTNAFPAIKRNGTYVDFRLADDSAYTTIFASRIGLNQNRLIDFLDGSNIRVGSFASVFLSCYNSGSTYQDILKITGNNTAPYTNIQNSLGVGFFTIPSAQLHIKGSGTTFNTTALLVQNSAGGELFKVLDSGSCIANGTISSGTLTSQRFFANSAFPFSIPFVFDAGSTSSANTSGVRDAYRGSFTYLPTSGTGELNIFNASPTINQTGGANGITRGLFINPTLTAAADFRAIEATQGNVLIGNGALNTAKLSIKGSSTTFSTTSLLVQNSAGTDAFKVCDDGTIFMGIGSASSLICDAGGPDKIRTSSVGVGIEGSPVSSAALAVNGTSKGFLPPRMTTAQKNAIATPASGLIVYDETTNKLACYNGTTWNDLF